MEAGGSGVIFGRNVWQREWNQAIGIIDQIKETLAKSRTPYSVGGPCPTGAWSRAAALASALTLAILLAVVPVMLRGLRGESAGASTETAPTEPAFREHEDASRDGA